MLKLKLQYFGHVMWRATSLEKTLMLKRLKAKIEGGSRGWDDWIAANSMDMSLSKLREIVKDREAWCATVHGVSDKWTRQLVSNWVSCSERGGWCFLALENPFDKPPLISVRYWLTDSGGWEGYAKLKRIFYIRIYYFFLSYFHAKILHFPLQSHSIQQWPLSSDPQGWFSVFFSCLQQSNSPPPVVFPDKGIICP